VDDDDEDASDDSDSDDDDDDEAELLAELARIKKEREEDAARKAAEEAAIAEKEERQEMMRGNPLLQDKLASDAAVGGAGASGSANFALKRRWDDDVVFKNQARNEPKQQRRFVNDTLRSDFHKRFLERYIK
jgi:protein CWC15